LNSKHPAFRGPIQWTDVKVLVPHDLEVELLVLHLVLAEVLRRGGGRKEQQNKTPHMSHGKSSSLWSSFLGSVGSGSGIDDGASLAGNVDSIVRSSDCSRLGLEGRRLGVCGRVFDR
jgi:hypothetical protein